jgi:ABC-type antimicrobial peptide transport system permease subunit
MASTTSMTANPEVQQHDRARWWQFAPLMRLAFWQGCSELLRKPAQSLPFVLSLALMLAMFVSLIVISRTLWLQPIAGVRDIEQIQHLEFKIKMGAAQANFFGVEMFDDLQQQLAGHQFALLGFEQENLSLDSQSVKVVQILTNTTAADLLGLQLLQGQLPAQSSGTQQVWISKALWQEHFASSPQVLGKTVTLRGNRLTIAGVVEHFAGHDFSDFTQPYQIWQFLSPTDLTSMQAQLKSTVLLTRHKKDLPLQTADLKNWFVNYTKGDHIAASMLKQIQVTQQPYQQFILGQSALLSLLLLGVSALLLAVTLLNLANLTAGRFTGREREMALQLVAGCTRHRLRLLVWFELLAWTLPSLLLSFWMAAWILRLLPDFTGDLFPLVNKMQLSFADAGLMLITVLLLTWLLTLPLIPSQLGSQLQSFLAASGKGVSTQRSLAKGWLLLQVWLSTSIVLTAGSLTLSSYHHIFQDLGYQRIAAMYLEPKATTALEDAKTPPTAAQNQAEFLRWQGFKQLIQQQQPDIQVLQAEGMPLQLRFSMRYYKQEDSDQQVMVKTEQIDLGYVELFQMPILHGRSLQLQDANQTQPRSILIDQQYASQLVGADLKKAIGLSLVQGEQQFKVIGIVQKTKSMFTMPSLYHLPNHTIKPGLVLSKRGGAEAISPQEQQQIEQLLQQAGFSEPLRWSSLAELFSQQTRQARLNLYLISLLATTSLVLAILGVAGIGRLYSHQRRYELAVRLATGASQRQLYQLMLTPLVPILALAVLFALLLSSQLLTQLWVHYPSMQQLDLSWQLALALLMWLVALLAGWWPVRQTLRQDPLQTLRSL